MSKKMLIDATHEEETRVAVVDGNRLVEFDYESKVRKQIKGNVFLAKVTRVEPSLQAAFVNYGGNRHGFLPFSEIHPDYYRIPIADRERLMAEQAEELSAIKQEEEELVAEEDAGEEIPDEDTTAEEEEDYTEVVGGESEAEPEVGADADVEPEPAESEDGDDADADEEDAESGEESPKKESQGGSGGRSRNNRYNRGGRRKYPSHRSRSVEVVGGDDINGDRPRRFNYRRRYKIQEVIKRGQIMLIQVSKEERGNKGAAVTTYLSLPGRYCVLMPNSPHGGGISRKIASFRDRRHMREILDELSVPEGMSVILRTAGVERTKAEIKRDFDYLLRLWDEIRELTLKSSAPALINEEGNLIKRSIRDIYTRDIEEIVISGAESYKSAKKFMKLLIPSHARKIREYKEEHLPLFQRYQVESQINETGEPSVTLKSGGYLVINPTEALVSIDVNSGRATKERHIEETALKTNLEAADEVARQLRLRDLGGLIVIDFIDMEERRNNAKVERRIKEALSRDRARIQIGRISSFGLMELSRQRMNPSLTESQFHRCPHCQGVGFVRTLDAATIAALRSVEEIGTRGHHSEVLLKVPGDVAIYILNHKRAMLAAIEERYSFKVIVGTDESIPAGRFVVEPLTVKRNEDSSDDEEDRDAAEDKKPRDSSDEDSGDQRKSSRRRGRRGGRRRSRTDSSSETDAPDNKGPEESREQAQGNDDGAVDPDLSEAGADQDDQKKKPAKRGRPARKKSGDDAVEATGSVTEDDVDGDGEKEKAPTGRKRGRKPAAKKEQAKTASENDASSVAKAEDNDRTEPRRSAEYEVVSQPGEKKKKGWWNKLVE